MIEKFRALIWLIRKKWFAYTLVLLAILFIIGATISIFTPAPPPNPDNQWRGVAPGFLFSEEKVAQTLGEPLAKTQTPEGTNHTYKSDYPTMPHEVITDSQDKVVLIKEYLPPDATETVANYENRLGKADLSLYLAETIALEAHVFLKTGVILISDSVGGVVREKWYITPTTEELFYKTWGEAFSQEPSSEPELFVPEEPLE